MMPGWKSFKYLKILPPQEQHLHWVLTSENAAGTKGKYSEKMKNPANYNKGNITLTMDVDGKQNCLNYNNDNLLILIIYKEMTAKFPKIFLLRILSINLSDIL